MKKLMLDHIQVVSFAVETTRGGRNLNRFSHTDYGDSCLYCLPEPMTIDSNC